MRDRQNAMKAAAVKTPGTPSHLPGAALWSRPDLGPVPSHVEHAYSPRPSTAFNHNTDHVVCDGPLLTGRLLRDNGDGLCKPRRRFWGLYDNMGATPSCARCGAMLAKLTAAGLVEQPTGNTTTRRLPCLAWDGLQHDPDPGNKGWIWSSEVCQTCTWPFAEHAPLARVARYVEPFASAAAHRLAVWPTAATILPLVQVALTEADRCIAGQPAMAPNLRDMISQTAVQTALAALEGR